MRDRLLIVEDDPRLGPIMRDVLSAAWDTTLTVTADDALSCLAATVFDVMIVDRRLPGMSGEDLVRTLRHRHDATPILLLTALGDLRDKVEGLDAGADDYLVKPFEFDELNARLRALTRDHTGRREGGIAIGSWVFFAEEKSIESPYAGRILLTAAETALLAVLAAHPTRTITREQLLGSAFSRGESPATVDASVHYLRRKTERDLVQTVRGVGYRLGTPA